MSFLQRTWNVGNAVVLLGFVGLGLSFWLPVATARRTARVESWAEGIAARLLEVAQPLAAEGALEGPAAAKRILEALGPGPIAERLRVLGPPETDAFAPGAYFEGKHYLYGVMRQAADPAAEPPIEAGALEVYAWPRSLLGPGGTAFFFPADAPATYTYNLRARYAGFEPAPRPGKGRPKEALEATPPADGPPPRLDYRSRDDERWIGLTRS